MPFSDTQIEYSTTISSERNGAGVCYSTSYCGLLVNVAQVTSADASTTALAVTFVTLDDPWPPIIAQYAH